MTQETIVITGATGQLGRLVLAHVKNAAPGAHLIGLVRDKAKGRDLEADGVELRTATYDDAAALTTALRGADKVLLISSSEIGQRVAQHRNVIAAAKANGVKLLGYTSLLRANRSPIGLAAEHKATEDELRASGVPFVILRNGWYTENYTPAVGSALQFGVVLGSAGTGRISAAARNDYAEAAAVVLSRAESSEAGRLYELAGDHGFTMTEFAAEVARQSGQPVRYQDLPQADYKAALLQANLPEPVANLLADSDAKAADGALFDDSGVLGQLIGRRTTPIRETVQQALALVAGGNADRAM